MTSGEDVRLGAEWAGRVTCPVQWHPGVDLVPLHPQGRWTPRNHSQPLFSCPRYCPIFNYRSIPQAQQHLLAQIFPDSRQGHSEQPRLPALLACCILYFWFLIHSNTAQLGPTFPSALTSQPWVRLGCGDPLLLWQ